MPEEPLPATIVPPEAQEGHPLAVAAKLGFGPLSEQARAVWHGESTPCASCAQLVQRDAVECPHCGQDLRQDMLEKMARHSGPWFVYDNVRPFPGVSLERMTRQIKRGVLQRTSIIRGPTTYHQWRYAGETPLIARLLGLCWHCQSPVAEEERFCPRCKVALDGHGRPEPGVAADSSEPVLPPAPPQLSGLSRALQDAGIDPDVRRLKNYREAPIGRTALIFFLIAVVIVTLTVAIVALGEREPAGPAPPAASAPEQS